MSKEHIEKVLGRRPVAANERPFFSPGQRISRRVVPVLPIAGAGFDHLYKRRGFDPVGSEMLTIVQVAPRTHRHPAGYFCRDKNGTLHLVFNADIQMVEL